MPIHLIDGESKVELGGVVGISSVDSVGIFKKLIDDMSLAVEADNNEQLTVLEGLIGLSGFIKLGINYPTGEVTTITARPFSLTKEPNCSWHSLIIEVFNIEKSKALT